MDSRSKYKWNKYNVKLHNSENNKKNYSLEELMKIKNNLIKKHKKKIEKLEYDISRSSNKEIKDVLNLHFKLLNEKQEIYLNQIKNIKSIEIQNTVMNNLAFSDECWISAYRNNIIQALNKYQVLIIKGESGYGKSTRIPVYVSEVCQEYGGKIASCQPFYVSVLSLSNYVSNYCKEQPDLEVGYNIGKQNTVNDKTSIVFTTCKNLLKESFVSPYLSKYSCIIIDECLDQSVEADILLLKIKEIIKQRPSFKLLLINPVYDIQKCKNNFDSVEVISLPSVTFPVKVVYNLLKNHEYVEKSSELAIFLCDKKPEGNICIFLPTVSEMEQCCEMIKNVLKDRVEYHILHNMTKQEQIFKLYLFSKYRRKIIFSTNCAESSIWLPNVFYVIDSGKLKEREYSLEKEFYISKENAVRRKKLAGWSFKNCCYRLYTEGIFEEMKTEPTPDILKMEESQLILTLYHYHISDPITAKFLYSSNKEYTKIGVNKLINFRAMKSDVLTALGKTMTNYMPMQTHHAKLIALGVQMGIGYEAVIIKIISSLKSPIFKTTGESKDIGKLRYFNEYGDYFAILNVYSDWKEQVNKDKWCEENGINHTALLNLDKKVNVTCQILKIKPQPLFSKCGKLHELICECFIHNICIYTGHFSLGYRSHESGKILCIHYSSVLVHKREIIEKYIVYGDIIDHHGKNFMINITPVSETVLETLICKDNIKICDLKLTKTLVSSEIFLIGTILTEFLLAKKGEQLEIIENRIKNNLGCDIIKIDVSVENYSISIYTYPEYIKEASYIVSNYLEQFSNKLQTKEEIMTIQHRNINFNLLLIKGLVIKEFDIQKVEKNSEYEDISEEQTLNFMYNYSINLSWKRRYCRGDGFVTLHSSEDFIIAKKHLSLKTIEIHGAKAEISVSRKNKNQFYVQGLNSETTNDILKTSIENTLPSEIKVKEASIVLNSEFNTSIEELELIKINLFLQFVRYINDDLKVEVTTPNSSDTKMKAYLNFNRHEDIPRVLDAIKNENIKFQDLTLKAFPVYRMTLICPIDQYNSVKVIINEKLLNKISNNTIKLKENYSKESVLLIVLSEDYIEAKEVETIITTELKGRLLEGLTSSQSKLFSHSGEQWLKQNSKLTETFVIQNFKEKTIRICGTIENYEKFKCKIAEYLKNAENEVISVININQGILNRSVIRALIQKYGINCDGFLKEFKLTAIELDIQYGQLTLYGMPKYIEEAVEELKSISQDYSFTKSENDSCPVCYGIPVSGLSYRLMYCGHLYCLDCIKLLLSERNIPLKCCKENCEKELVMDDIQHLLQNNKEEINKLLYSSLTAYVKENYKTKRFCPSPDCKMIYSVSSLADKNTIWNCSVCNIIICSICGFKVHHGMSCEMAKEIRKDEDYSLKAWIALDPQRRKICPSCTSPIEKYEGCNHVTCWKCQCHMCWLCLQTFPNSKTVYDHLPYCVRNQIPFV